MRTFQVEMQAELQPAQHISSQQVQQIYNNRHQQVPLEERGSDWCSMASVTLYELSSSNSWQPAAAKQDKMFRKWLACTLFPFPQADTRSATDPNPLHKREKNTLERIINLSSKNICKSRDITPPLLLDSHWAPAAPSRFYTEKGSSSIGGEA